MTTSPGHLGDNVCHPKRFANTTLSTHNQMHQYLAIECPSLVYSQGSRNRTCHFTCIAFNMHFEGHTTRSLVSRMPRLERITWSRRNTFAQFVNALSRYPYRFAGRSINCYCVLRNERDVSYRRDNWTLTRGGRKWDRVDKGDVIKFVWLHRQIANTRSSLVQIVSLLWGSHIPCGSLNWCCRLVKNNVYLILIYWNNLKL